MWACMHVWKDSHYKSGNSDKEKKYGTTTVKIIKPEKIGITFHHQSERQTYDTKTNLASGDLKISL